MCDTRSPGDLPQRSVRHPVLDVSAGRLRFGRLGLALVVLSMVEQRLDAVRAVLAGADVTEIAASIGVHRSTVHRWVGRCLSEQLAGLVDRSHRPHFSPAQVKNAVEVAVAEMRRTHPRWGARRIRLEMLRQAGPWFRGDLAVPSERTIDRILQRQGLLRSRPRKRPKESFLRWERPAAMQLWQLNIVGGVRPG
jgi:transposase